MARDASGVRVAPLHRRGGPRGNRVSSAPGKPKYFGRPSLQLRDEMVASGAHTVAELPAKRIAVFYHGTRPSNAAAKRVLVWLFGGPSSR